jgi:hypothetical protein
MNKTEKLSASFRDPNGFLFTEDGVLYRQINHKYQANYQHLHESGLYDFLIKKGWMTSYAEVDHPGSQPERTYKVVKPHQLAFISYPYEWSFSQLKDAALLTLKIQKAALKYSMSLKDSSAYNIQFDLSTGKPVLIDTLSFEIYNEGQPWVAYRQYCQHFLGPLAMMAHTDISLSLLSRVYIDGPPLPLVSKLLPGKTKRNFGLLSHIHAHARAQDRYADKQESTGSQKMSKNNLLAIIDSLERSTQKLTWQSGGTEWGDYYRDTNYIDNALENKKKLVEDFIQQASPNTVWDMGANTGLFSRIASDAGIPTIAFDIDPTAVELNYQKTKSDKGQNMLPLILDLTNPSPDLGWANQERDSLFSRQQPDLIMALALVHHLAISNNVPLEMVAEMFSRLSPWLMIEFVPKEDSQVQRLLSTRQDIFEHYHREGFEAAFQQYYDLKSVEEIAQSARTLYLFLRKGA